MISTFDQWLTRASTHRLLRLLIADSRTSAQTRVCQTQRRYKQYQQANWSLPIPPIHDGRPSTRFYDHGPASQTDHVINTLRESPAPPRSGPEDREKAHPTNILPFGIAHSVTHEVIAEVHNLGNTNLTDQVQAIDTWLSILQDKVRVGDLDGVGHDWKHRKEYGLELPVRGRAAEEIWQIYISAAVQLLLERKTSWLLDEILDYAREVSLETSERYVHLFRDIIGGLLLDYRHSRSRAKLFGPLYYRRMAVAGLTSPTDLVSLLEEILRSDTPDTGFRRFKLVYSQQKDGELDRQCIRLIKRYGHVAGSDAWLSFFGHALESGAGGVAPSDIKSNPLNTLPNHGATLHPPPLTRQMMNTLLGEVHGVEEKSFSDEFCARVLATKFFSLETCIKGLHALGVNRFGSIAILELTRRAQEPALILERLEQAHQAGIELQDSVFLRMVKHFAKNGHGILLQQLLASDQHPDEYQNVRLQRDLLLSYVDRREWLRMETTLVALSLSGQRMESTYWNVLLRHHINIGDQAACQRIFEDIRARNIRLKSTTVQSIFSMILPTRRIAHAPNPRTQPAGWSSRAATDYAMAACTYAAECGEKVPPSMFTEILKRYALTYQNDALETLLFWLGDFYSAERMAQQPDLPAYGKGSSGQNPIQDILQSQMIEAIVIWEWRTAVMNQPLMPNERSQGSATHFSRSYSAHAQTVPQHSWFRGISLLRHLNDRGHHVDVNAIRHAIAEQLWKIFGPGRSVRKINGILENRNTMALQEYLEQAEQVWPGIFTTDEFAGLDYGKDQHQLLLALFGKQRSTSHRGNEIDISQWSADDYASMFAIEK